MKAFDQLCFSPLSVDRLHDQSYRLRCCTGPDTIRNAGPSFHEEPRGWVLIGLEVPLYAEVQSVLRDWAVSFHGLPSGMVRES